MANIAVKKCQQLYYNLFNKHKPWIETTYHGIVTENDNTVLLDPPLIALDKDAPLRFAGRVREPSKRLPPQSSCTCGLCVVDTALDQAFGHYLRTIFIICIHHAT
ncbi:Calsyntenin-1 [Chelonia mydas]|uniref:Calsyntenin-1 n=1 Tax=Chelonia mydas TaxID=8469 RepID=M7APV5_CHEMY|nr:Calsyntenin-1 [Chelonia mydas]